MEPDVLPLSDAEDGGDEVDESDYSDDEDLDYAIACFEEFLDSRAGILSAD